MSTRFFRTALTTGMTGGSIDPDLAASLKARDCPAGATSHTSRRTTFGFSTLLQERSHPAEPRPAKPLRCLRRALKRLSAS